MVYGSVNYKGYTREDALESVGTGWSTLINKVFDVLETIKGTVKIVQVKEKFGGLRIYTDFSNKELDDIITKVEYESFLICEECGNPGKLRDGSWYATLCDAHADGRKPIRPF
jgi:hypothetical protein